MAKDPVSTFIKAITGKYSPPLFLTSGEIEKLKHDILVSARFEWHISDDFGKIAEISNEIILKEDLKQVLKALTPQKGTPNWDEASEIFDELVMDIYGVPGIIDEYEYLRIKKA